MIVSKLIETLKEMPQDAEVLHLWDGDLRTTINIVYLARNGQVVTSDFNEVCYSTDCRPVDAPTSEEDRYWYTPNSLDSEDDDW